MDRLKRKESSESIDSRPKFCVTCNTCKINPTHPENSLCIHKILTTNGVTGISKPVLCRTVLVTISLDIPVEDSNGCPLHTYRKETELSTASTVHYLLE